MTLRRQQKLKAFVDFAHSIATLSTCKRLQVGSVICDAKFQRVESIGYNGPARGLFNNACRDLKGACGCAHAEANALVKLRTWDRDLILISTVSPCEQCANLIANCGAISTVVCCEQYRETSHLLQYPFVLEWYDQSKEQDFAY